MKKLSKERVAVAEESNGSEDLTLVSKPPEAQPHFPEVNTFMSLHLLTVYVFLLFL